MEPPFVHEPIGRAKAFTLLKNLITVSGYCPLLRANGPEKVFAGGKSVKSLPFNYSQNFFLRPAPQSRRRQAEDQSHGRRQWPLLVNMKNRFVGGLITAPHIFGQFPAFCPLRNRQQQQSPYPIFHRLKARRQIFLLIIGG